MRFDRRASLILFTSLSVCLSAGCEGSRDDATSESPAQPTAEQFGAMRDVMRDGQTEPRVRLQDTVAEPHAVAVGALAALDGEITIVNGDVWVARVTDDGLSVTGPEPLADDHATLLTLAHVAEWQTAMIDDTVEGRELDVLIEQTALELGIDTTRPFPLLIEGELTQLNIHVINGYCPIATDPATVDAQPWRWSNSQPTDVTIVGFYAPDAAGVMTHHGTSVHAHAILSINGKTVTGHVDRVVVEPGMTLSLPASG